MSVVATKPFVRVATPADAEAIARIYNEGIDDRIATFETRHRTSDDVTAWFDGVHPVVVVEDNGAIAAFASTSTYRPRECYAGIGEYSVYVDRRARGRGLGRIAMEALIAAARDGGFWKLISRIFPENTSSLRLMRSLGFREVGTYHQHAKLDGEWRDVIIVEKLLLRPDLDVA
jgi:L-amino acid N-acyltransferase YncA